MITVYFIQDTTVKRKLPKDGNTTLTSKDCTEDMSKSMILISTLQSK